MADRRVCPICDSRDTFRHMQTAASNDMTCKACGAVFCGHCKRVDRVMSEDQREQLAETLRSNLPEKRCKKCGGMMAHYRLGGWKCIKGC